LRPSNYALTRNGHAWDGAHSALHRYKFDKAGRLKCVPDAVGGALDRAVILGLVRLLYDQHAAARLERPGDLAQIRNRSGQASRACFTIGGEISTPATWPPAAANRASAIVSRTARSRLWWCLRITKEPPREKGGGEDFGGRRNVAPFF